MVPLGSYSPVPGSSWAPTNPITRSSTAATRWCPSCPGPYSDTLRARSCPVAGHREPSAACHSPNNCPKSRSAWYDRTVILTAPPRSSNTSRNRTRGAKTGNPARTKRPGSRCRRILLFPHGHNLPNSR